METPVFLFCQARSGSTWLQRMLNSTGEVLIAGEHGGLLSPIADAWKHNERWRREMIRPVSRETFTTNNFYAAISTGLIGEDWYNLFRRFVRALATPLPAPRWGFKEILYGGKELRFLRELWPAAQFVCVLRDPVEQITSMIRRDWWPTTLDEKIDLWRRQCAAYQGCQREFPTSVKLVRYEDMRTQMREIFTFLDLSWTPEQDRLISERIGPTPNRKPLAEETQRIIRAACAGNGIY